MTPALRDLAARAGIAAGYSDTTGTRHLLCADTARALLAAMGLPAASEAEAAETGAALGAEAAARVLPEWQVVTTGQAAAISTRLADGARVALLAEDGAETGLAAGPSGAVSLPPLPAGYHRIVAAGRTCLVLTAPSALPLPAPGWGVTLPLYGLRSAEEGGYGSYADLAAAASGLAALGADFVGINPVHAGFPGDSAAFSPYAPSHRRRLNTAHVAVPGAAGTRSALIDYAADLPAQAAALEAAFAARGQEEDAALDAALVEGGLALRRFATHQALSEVHGPYWPDWPAALRDPDGAAVAVFAAEHVARLRFHAWAQARAAEQLSAARAAAAGMAQGLYLDLAVGTHPGGAETWEDRASFAAGVSLGAPPDAFAPNGQSWALAPFDPRALVAQGFRPLIETLRAQLRFAGMLRIDHILGFARTFWVPGNGAPGGYVAMPRAAMLAVTRIEAARAGAVIVGEDLGNVPDDLRAEMQAGGILGCRIAMFERDPAAPERFRPPEAYDPVTLAAFATHDLPTWAGWRAARDIDWRLRLGEIASGPAASMRAARAAEVAAFDAMLGQSAAGAPALHAALARAASRLVAVQAEDMLGHLEQPNLPGTVHDHPNWRRRLGMPAAALARDPGLRASAAAMNAARPRARSTPSPMP